MPTKTIQVTTKFYTFAQNNSGGKFKGPAKYLIIEETSSDKAFEKLLEVTDYMEGDGCSCCGERWSRPWRDEGTESPLIYGLSPEAFLEEQTRRWGPYKEKVEFCKIIPLA